MRKNGVRIGGGGGGGEVGGSRLGRLVMVASKRLLGVGRLLGIS